MNVPNLIGAGASSTNERWVPFVDPATSKLLLTALITMVSYTMVTEPSACVGTLEISRHTGPMADCPICTDNAAAEEGVDPWFIARLETGYVRLAPNQYFRGSVFFVARQCVREVFDLDDSLRHRHLAEMAELAAAVNEAFEPRKLNIESLGNGVPHLHWWITPRYETDPRPRGPFGRISTFCGFSGAKAVVRRSRSSQHCRVLYWMPFSLDVSQFEVARSVSP